MDPHGRASTDASTDARPVSPNWSVRVALRATCVGVLIAAALLGVVAILASSSLVAAPLWPSCWGGLGLAAVTTALGNLLLAASLLDRRASSGASLARAVFLDLLLHLIVGGGTALTLFLLRTKFLAAATFALAFAGSVAVMRIAGAVVLARTLKSAAARPAPERPERQV